MKIKSLISAALLLLVSFSANAHQLQSCQNVTSPAVYGGVVMSCVTSYGHTVWDYIPSSSVQHTVTIGSSSQGYCQVTAPLTSPATTNRVCTPITHSHVTCSFSGTPSVATNGCTKLPLGGSNETFSVVKNGSVLTIVTKVQEGGSCSVYSVYGGTSVTGSCNSFSVSGVIYP